MISSTYAHESGAFGQNLSTGSVAIVAFPSVRRASEDRRRKVARLGAISSEKRANPESGSFSWQVPNDIGHSLAKSLRQRLDAYRHQLRHCQKEFSAGSVHQLRVASRRLMTQFGLVAVLLSSHKAEKTCKLLKRRLKLLGELRDTQVQRMFIEGLLQRFPELAPLRRSLIARESRLARFVEAKLARFKVGKIKKATARLARPLSTAARDRAHSELLARTVFRALADAFQEVVSRRQGIDSADSQTIHRTRVAFKKFRYLLESLSPTFTGMGKCQLRRLAGYQRRMGTLQDLEILQAFVTSFLQNYPERTASLLRFCSYLEARRLRTLRSYLSHADQLFQFWLPLPSDPKSATTLTRVAA